MSRVLVKMSGEAVIDVDGESIISVERLDMFSEQIAEARETEPSLEVLIVVGGGNILRGKSLRGVERTKADHMGMLATVINALALQDSLARSKVESRVMTGVEIPKVAEPYIYGRAMRHLEKGRVVVLAGGVGIPYVTTDTAAALRAADTKAEIVLLAKFGTNGVYDKDPRKVADAVKYRCLGYDLILAKNLQIMDSSAVAICRDNDMPIYVFDMDAPGGVRDALLGNRGSGTLVLPDSDRSLPAEGFVLAEPLGTEVVPI